MQGQRLNKRNKTDEQTNNPYDTKNNRLASIDTNANVLSKNESNKFEEGKNQTVIDSINQSKGAFVSSACELNESECKSENSIAFDDQAVSKNQDY